MTLDSKLIEAFVKTGSLLFTVTCGLIGAGWTLVRYFDQKDQERLQRLDLERQRLDQQRVDEEGRRSERVTTLLAEFNKSTDLEKKTWTILALSLYPKETGRLLAMSLGQFDDDISKAVLLALVSIGPDVMPELIRLNRMAQVFSVETLDPHQAASDIYHVERLAARTKVALQNILLQADGTSIEQYDLADVDLSKAMFRGVTFKGANFRKCALSEAIFKQARITNGNFRGAVLTKAVFTKAHLQHCDFTGATGPLQAIGLTLKHCTFEQAALEQSHFEGAHFEACTFLKATLERADLPGASALACTFDHTDLRHIKASQSTWAGSAFSHAKLTGASLSHGDLSGCTFDGCELMGLSGGSVVGPRARFSHCKFGGSSWASADFTEATFEDCHFGGADFTGCNLTHATFTDCVIDTGKFDGDVAALNRITRPST